MKKAESGTPENDPNVEGILYADIDLDDALLPKLRHDVGGSYNRFDVMTVLANRAAHQSVREMVQRQPATQASGAIDEEETPDTDSLRGMAGVKSH